VTLQRYLARLIAWCVTPLVALALGLGWWQFQTVRHEQEAEALRLTGLLAQSVDRMLQVRQAALQALAASPLVDDEARWPELRLQALGVAQALGGSVLLVDGNGRMRLHSAVSFGEPLPPPARPESRAAVPLAFETGQPAVGDPFMGPIAGEAMVAVAVPVMRGQRVAYVLANVLPLRFMEPLLGSLAVPAGWVLAVADTRGRPLAQRGVDDAAEGAMLRFVARPTLVPWTAEVRLPQADHTQQLWRLASLLVLPLLGVTLICVLGGAWATRRLSLSVRSLAAAGATPTAPGELEEIRQTRRLLDDARAEREEAVESLRVREAQLGGIFASASEAIITVDASQRIVLANPAAARVFGLSVERMLGLPLERLLPERFRKAHHDHVERFGRSGQETRAMGPGARVTGLHADGHEFPLEAAISQARADGQHLFTVILRDVTEQQRIADELKVSHRDLERLIAAQTSVQEEERRRIALALHDELQQVLAAIKLEIGAILPDMAAEPSRLPALALRLDELASAAITSCRRIVSDLMPQLLEELGLLAALELLAAEHAQRRSIQVEVHSDAACMNDGEPRDAVALCLYRVAQEAMNNVAKHAEARRVQIRLSRTPGGGWELRIADDGRGLSADDRRKPASFGLRGMAERVRALGGELRVDSTGGHGVVVTARVGAGGAHASGR